MNFSNHNTVSINQILADVFPLVGEDGSFKEYNKGYYISQVQRALETLSLDTFFDERTVAFPVPNNLALDIPKGMFNLKNMYLNNSDGCALGNDSVNVYRKSDFWNNDGSGSENYVSKNKGGKGSRDPFYNRTNFRNSSIDAESRNYSTNPNSRIGEIDNAYYYNIQNGVIMLSSSCKKFPYVIMVFNGISTEIGDTPIIPIQFREVVIDLVAESVLRAKAAKAPVVYREQYNDSKQRLGRNPYNPSGTWWNAMTRIAAMDNKARDDYKLYLGKFVK